MMKRLVSLALVLVLTLGAVAFAPRASAADGPSCLAWVSAYGYGTETTGVPKGHPAHVCYELYADGTGETKLNDAYSYEYTATLTIYKPDGSVAHTKTVYNDDEYWISFKTSTVGTYTYKIVFTGELRGTFTGSYTVYDPAKTTIRLAGTDRFDTAIKVAEEMKYALGVEKFDNVIIASGLNFADALSGSYLASVKKAPILLSCGLGGDFTYLDLQNILYILDNLAENGTVYILGSEDAVPAIYEAGLTDVKVKRLGGIDRFDTNLMILKEAGVKDGSEILVCTATNFADSLSASATGKPILLVFNEWGYLYGKQPDYLKGLKNCKFTIIGGENAVRGNIANQLSNYGKVSRLAGANRFETSVMVAERYFGDVDTAVLAYAWNFPDGLCGGPLAYAQECPLILTMDRFESLADAYAEERGMAAGTVLGSSELISNSTAGKIFPSSIFAK